MKEKGWKNKIQEYIQKHEKQKRWYKVTAILAAAAVLVTGGMMIFPAVTLENSPQMLECQIDVHTHTDNCYDKEGNLTCGYADFVVHTHDSSCYAEDGTLICPLSEIEAHTHDDSCYREKRVLICGQEETAPHTHQGHIHTEACYEDSEKLVCGQEETESHTHTDDCYETEKKLICTQDTGCYDEKGNLICEKEETKGHTHMDDCYEIQKELICGKKEIILHTHTDSCYDESGNLTCGMLEVKEHVHDESCIPKKESEKQSAVQSGTSWVIVSKSGYTSSGENADKPASNNALLTAPQAETDSYDFSDNITSVTMERQQGGQWTPSETFTDGDNVRVTIYYAIPQGIINQTHRNMHYQLPEGIALEKEETGDVSLSDGQDVGTYTISTDGLISITFNENFANGEAFSGNLHFQGFIALADTGEDQEIQFGGDGGSITVVPEEKQYNLGIGKPGVYVRDEADAERYRESNLGINVEPEHLLYTIEVRADENSDGSNGAITVTDRFTHNPADGVVTYDEGNIAIFKITPTSEGKYSAEKIENYDLKYVHQQTGTQDTQTGTFTITGLPALAPGERYSINYSASVDFNTVNSPNGYISVSNEASAQDSSRTVKADSNVEISRRMVHKEVSANEGTGNVQWTVTLNEDGRDLSGRTFRDEMTYTLNGETKAYPLEDMGDIKNLRVTAYEIDDEGQQVSKGDVTPAFEKLLKFEDSKMTVAFPKAGEWPDGLSSNWVYKIIYETPFPEGAQIGDDIAFSNTARLDTYHETVNWNGQIPENGYGLVKERTGYDLNTGTDTGTVDWQSTISYPSADFDLESLRYTDWIADAYYDSNGTFIPGSHYTTAETLNNTLHVKNAAGEELVWGTDYTVSVIYAKDMPDYSTFQEAQEHAADIFAKERIELVKGSGGDDPIALFCITFTDESRDKLNDGQRLYISYQTLLDRQKVTDGKLVKIYNTGAIAGHMDQAFLETSFHEQLRKQVSTTGLPPSGDDYALDSDVYVDDPVQIDLGDTGGRIYYRVLFYNYGDVIEFHDNMLQQFNGHFTFEQQMRIYNVVTGEIRTVKTWDYLNSDGRYDGDYKLENLDEFKDCIIGLYYSLEVSADEDLEEGETYTYTNTIEWKDVGNDSASAEVTNNESTLKKVGYQTTENGTNLVYYYVTINPAGRNLHPASSSLELQDNLKTSAGAFAILRLDTIGLYHYDAENADGHYLGEEVTEEEFADFAVEKAEGADNSYIFTVPDEMACVVVYAYEIDPGTSALDEITVDNTASLLGRAVISAGDQIKIQAQESGGQVNKATLTIYKIGGNDYTNLLQGVLFDLFRYEQQEDGTTYQWTRTDLTAQGTPADDGGRHFITGGDGVEGAIILNFLDEGGEGQSSYYNTLYRLTEFQTLEGYELDPTPRYYVWGQLGMTEEETAAAMADALQKAGVTWDQVVFIPFGQSKTEYINNEPLNTSVTAVKQWMDTDGTTRLPEDEIPENITLTLYQHADGEKMQYGDPVTVTPDQETGRWTYTWESLPRKDENGNYCTYSVEETAIAGENDMSGYEISYYYPDGKSPETGIEKGEITITNTKIASYILPETGGTGAAPFVTAGLFLAGISGAGYLYIRKQRR